MGRTIWRRSSRGAGSASPTPPKRVLQRTCGCGQHAAGGECESCRKRKTESLQRRAFDGAGVTGVPSIVDRVVDSAGDPLDSHARGFFEPRFGQDFSQVRVHSDTVAAESADAVDALAFTVGPHVVFGAGRFAPHTADGRQLLAHELAHVVQQRAGIPQPGGSLSVDPDPALEADARQAGAAIDRPSQSGPLALQRAPKPHITDINVDQATPQKVTATFSDGHSEAGECSSGKGHCCVDDAAGTAGGGACTKARSTQVGNNCTPIGDFTVTSQLRKTSGGVEWWTQFHDAKSVALHEYTPVDGTPLSHGCVRLHSAFAQTIFNNSKVGTTRVHVANAAQPKCDHKALQNEWAGDFTTAGSKPPDGEAIDPFTGKKYTKEDIAAERRNIREERRALKSALDKDEAGLDTEIADVNAGTPVARKIPRCVPELTVEEKLAPGAQKAGIAGADATTTTDALKKALKKTTTLKAAEAVVTQAGEKLWQSATAAARGGGSGSDDRRLYWMRLLMTTEIRAFDPQWAADADALRRVHERLLHVFEQTSRGMTTDVFPAAAGTKQLLVSGFDPFGFQGGGAREQGNPSGAAVLALDGQTLSRGSVSGRVEGVLFPVRYKDFNEGIVEQHLQPHLAATPPPSIVVSISQGGSGDFELEEWAGRRRSSGPFKENLGRAAAGPNRPEEPPGLAAGPEFLETSTPSKTLGAMRGALGRKTPLRGETEVEDLPKGAASARKSASGPPKDAGPSVAGSGGGFLSNEIFYRNRLLATSTGSKVPMVHLHTPFMDPTAGDTVRNGLITTIRTILEAALPQL